MSRVHDVGGRLGFGAVPVDAGEIFAEEWERRAFAVTQLSQAAAGFNTDAFRHGIEREDSDTYVHASYFEKWIRNAERMIVEGGVVGADAVSARIAGTDALDEPARTTDAKPPEGRGARRPIAAAPRYAVGDRVTAVRAPTTANATHTRLPGYVAGHVGTIALVNGGWVFPDTHAHGRGEQPEWVYSVRFQAGELWPESSGTDHHVFVDLFEPYLEPT